MGVGDMRDVILDRRTFNRVHRTATLTRIPGIGYGWTRGDTVRLICATTTETIEATVSRVVYEAVGSERRATYTFDQMAYATNPSWNVLTAG